MEIPTYKGTNDMKINWGTAIVIAFVCFISFIMYFVIRMSTNEKYEHDLVVEDYYQQELKFQSDIDKETNSKSLETNVSWTKTADGVKITFPKDFDIKNVIVNLNTQSKKFTVEYDGLINLFVEILASHLIIASKFTDKLKCVSVSKSPTHFVHHKTLFFTISKPAYIRFPLKSNSQIQVGQ